MQPIPFLLEYPRFYTNIQYAVKIFFTYLRFFKLDNHSNLLMDKLCRSISHCRSLPSLIWFAIYKNQIGGKAHERLAQIQKF